MRIAIVLGLLLAAVATARAQATVCVINANCRWASTVNVCGRFGRSNLCTRFRNTCYLQASGCSGPQYTAVNLSLCAGIGLNQRRACRGTNGGTTSTINGNGNGLLSGLFGSTNSGANVTPIIIRG